MKGSEKGEKERKREAGRKDIGKKRGRQEII